MVRAGFFRNRGAYLVGRLVLKGTELKPLVIALLNSEEGVRAEAVLHAVPHVHNLCSSTEAPFQVTNRHYHELAAFLKSIMPSRPLGLHYSTIGYYHFSKVAVMNEVRRRLVRERELLAVAPGSPGTVTIAFTSPRLDYVLKVIRDRPTSAYKWDSFDGLDVVLAKYKRVHEINRTGSMLDTSSTTISSSSAPGSSRRWRPSCCMRRATACASRAGCWCSSTSSRSASSPPSTCSSKPHPRTRRCAP